MAKICSNCACREVCFHMIPGRTQDCKLWKPEVVRCKDCKHWLHLEDGIGDCTNGRFHIHGVADITMNAEEFCCLVERRTNDD